MYTRSEGIERLGKIVNFNLNNERWQDFDPIADMAMDIDVTDEEMENKTDEYGRMPDLDSSPIRVKRNISPEVSKLIQNL